MCKSEVRTAAKPSYTRRYAKGFLVVGVAAMMAASLCLIALGHRQNMLDRELIKAAQQNNVAEISRLLSQGADPNAKASATMSMSFTQRLKRRLLHPSERTPTGWQTAALPLLLRGDDSPNRPPDLVPALKVLLNHGADINATDENGDTPLMIALADGNKPVTVVLLEHGVDVNRHNIYGGTALILYANVDDVNLLLKHGVDIDAVDGEGCTALLMAVDRGDVDMAMNLLRHGANRHLKDKSGRTALSIAVADHQSTLIPGLR